MTPAIPRTRAGLVALLESRGLRLKKRLGQSFLVDPQLADAIVADACVTARDSVVEIGPGAGALTQPLLEASGQVTAVEVDAGLFELLRENLAGNPKLRLVHGDCLEGGLHPAIVDAIAGASRDGFERSVVIANLPYSVGTAALARLIDLETPPCAVVAMLQAEVCDRLRAVPGTREYGPLAVLAATSGRVEVLRHVPPAVFFPRPSVESVVFRWTPDPLRRVQADLRRRVVALTGVAFRKRRKTLVNALAGFVDEAQLRAAGIDPVSRPEAVAPDAWVRLAATLTPDRP